jgi:trk system potassium uptake protein TrkH
MSFNSKVVTVPTAILILVSAVSFFITERDASMSGMSVYQRVLASLFQAVTPRTRGLQYD